MSSPLVTIMPPSGSHLIYFVFLLLFLAPLWSGNRYLIWSKVVSTAKMFLPSYAPLQGSGLVSFMGGFLIFVSMSLVPFSVIGFHFPLLGIGVSFSVWVGILVMSNLCRSFQFKKEYLGDSSLSWVWVVVSVGLETISRAARAITLGARISVNVMMGGILHSVIGSSDSSWGLIILCFFEVLVVVIQTYVFSLLIFLYSVELE